MNKRPFPKRNIRNARGCQLCLTPAFPEGLDRRFEEAIRYLRIEHLNAFKNLKRANEAEQRLAHARVAVEELVKHVAPLPDVAFHIFEAFGKNIDQPPYVFPEVPQDSGPPEGYETCPACQGNGWTCPQGAKERQACEACQCMGFTKSAPASGESVKEQGQ